MRFARIEIRRSQSITVKFNQRFDAATYLASRILVAAFLLSTDKLDLCFHSDVEQSQRPEEIGVPPSPRIHRSGSSVGRATD